ncbi:glycosyltransferase [Sinomonas mesophila]|uniref:glycosyltransferase n=1 Tax=Sinomonas mesophila TaxID=1531955 RepID=UPI001FE4EFCA|nr:glycosyltransferase [Sinomonas mesophila]
MRLVAAEGLGYASGGTVFNECLADALRGLGAAVELRGVPGAWPVGSPADRARLAAALALGDGADDGGTCLLVDGLLACGAPEETARAAADAEAGGRLGILVHMSLPDAPGLEPPEAERLARLEKAALAAAHAVFSPSEFAAQRLARRHGTAARVARPGVVRAPEAPGSLAASGVPRIVCFAALLPGKGQLGLVRALGALRDLAWTAELAGHDGADPAYADAVRSEAGRLGIAGRVDVPGELRGSALEGAWDRADLTVLPSASETFGLSVAESLARGIPAVVGAGTGAEEALGLSLAGGLGLAGTACGTGEGELARVLGAWLTDASLRARWREAARAARPLLPGWDATARAVAEGLGFAV